MAWCCYIPPKLYGVLILNLLEILASETTIYIIIQQLGQVSHIISFIDSSVALGWMHNSSFNPVKEEPHDKVAQCMGRTLVRI